MLDEQKTQVEQVLDELDVATKPVIEVMNKIDLVSQDERVLLSKSGRVLTSGLTHQGLEELLMAIDSRLIADPVIEMELRLPQSEGAILAALEAGAILSEKRFAGNLVYVSARGPASLLTRFRGFQTRRSGEAVGQSSALN
jgi:GTP-binding protein HflX